MNEKKWFGASISKQVYDKVKKFSSDSGIRIQAIVENALLEYIEKHIKKQRR